MQSSSGAGKFPLIFEVRLRSWSRVQGSPLRVESCLGHSSTWWRLVFRCPHQSSELPCSTALREFSGVLGPRLLWHKRLQVYIRWLIPAGLLLGIQWQLAFLPSLSCYSFLYFSSVFPHFCFMLAVHVQEHRLCPQKPGLLLLLWPREHSTHGLSQFNLPRL